MKNLIYIILIIFMIPMVSCDEDFLEKTPLDQITEPEFWKTSNDLKLYANSFYQNLPGWSGVGVGYAPNPDNGSDVSLYTGASSRLMGNTSVPSASTGSIWGWSNVRKANYFLSNVDKAEGIQTDIDHYTGEGYFFRAYYYMTLLSNYGDLPIIDTYITDEDTDVLYGARSPRNEVVDFMLADLDKAISLLKSKSEASTARINKEVAQLFKARLALFEGTWEKYHAGTDFGVAGSDGSAYLNAAAVAAKAVIDGGAFSLHSDYGSLFNQTNLSSNNEVMLWKQYDYLTFGKSYGNDLQVMWPNRSGYTRFAVRSYLCTDGQPISVSPLYKGDLGLDSLETNRDPRLAATIMVPGDIISIDVSDDTTFFEVPAVAGGNNSCVTAYEGQKYRDVVIDVEQNNYTRNTAKIIYRYAEVLLIYAEAKAELGTIEQGDLDMSINLLRARAGMPNLTMASITVDPEWPNYGYQLTDVLYEIRRERSVELLGEGFRFTDLMRWRAHELFLGKRPKGAYYEQIIVDEGSLKFDDENYIDPYQTSVPSGYGFDINRDYLSPLPTDELVLNENLTQNPGWQE